MSTNRAQQPGDDTQSRIAQHWDTIHLRKRVRWWHMRTISEEINRLVCKWPLKGISRGAIELAQQAARGRQFERGVSVGGATGSKEMQLLKAGLVRHMTIFELSGKRIEDGRKAARKQGLEDRIRFVQGDAFKQGIGRGSFDFVHWNNALHHMFNVKSALKWSRRVLTPDGMFYMDDYVGPNRFQWSDASLKAASQIRQGLPARLRKSAHDNQEEVPPEIGRPSKRRIKREDPSEAPDSARILKCLHRTFPSAHVIKTGGLAYNLALTHVLHNFDEEKEIDRQILRDLMLLDRVLLDNPAIDNHYAVAIAWADGSPVQLSEASISAAPGMPPAHHCPVCDSDIEEFVPGGHYGRPGAKCPKCGALERHRAAWLHLDRERPWEHVKGRPFRLLHVAPEAPLESRFLRIPSVDYLSVDIEPGKAMTTMDLTRVEAPDEPYDMIFCSHVLEHIPDDLAAMRGLLRLVKKGGLVLIQVPLRGKQTYEDSSITSPEARKEAFGQEDHVRIYGADILERLQAAGFHAEIVHPDRALPGAEKRRMNTGNRPVIVCKK